MAHRPLQRLHAAHRRADHAHAAGRCRAASVSSRCCAATMSRRAKRGKRMPGCAALFEGEVERPLPIGSVAITNQRAGSSALPGPIRKSSRWCVPESEAQIRTAFERSAFERAVGDVRLAVVDDRLARLELQVAERELAMRRVDVVGGERWMLHRRPAQRRTRSTVRMPSPRARPAKPSLISSRAMRRVISSSSLSLPSS